MSDTIASIGTIAQALLAVDVVFLAFVVGFATGGIFVGVRLTRLALFRPAPTNGEG